MTILLHHADQPTGWPKIFAQFFVPLTLSLLTDFRNYVTVRIRRKICNNTIIKEPTTLQVCDYTTL